MDKKIFFGVFVFCIFLSGFVGAESNPFVGTSEKGVEYDRELIAQFLVSEWVHVTVKLQDNTNINFSKKDSDNQFREKLDERTIILNTTTNSILYSLLNEEFQLEKVFPLGNGFYGNITKEGFEKLLQDERIRKIYAKKYIHENLYGSISFIFSKNIFIYFIPIILLIFIITILIKLKKRKNKSGKRKS